MLHNFCVITTYISKLNVCDILQIGEINNTNELNEANGSESSSISLETSERTFENKAKNQSFANDASIDVSIDDVSIDDASIESVQNNKDEIPEVRNHKRKCNQVFF